MIWKRRHKFYFIGTTNTTSINRTGELCGYLIASIIIGAIIASQRAVAQLGCGRILKFPRIAGNSRAGWLADIGCPLIITSLLLPSAYSPN
jgi:hypothetical protein